MSSKMQMVFPYPGKRFPQNVDKVTFKKSKELKLRDFVTEKSNFKQTPCLFEMSLVFTCLKESDFNDSLCMEELEKFNNCYTRVSAEQYAVNQRRRNPTKVTVADKLLGVEINQLLQKYKLKGK